MGVYVCSQELSAAYRICWVFSCFVFFASVSGFTTLGILLTFKTPFFGTNFPFFFSQICWRSTQTCYYVTLLKMGRFWMEFYNLPWSIEQCIYLPRFFPFTHLWLLTTNMTRTIWQFFINFRIHFKFAQKWNIISSFLGKSRLPWPLNWHHSRNICQVCLKIFFSYVSMRETVSATGLL